MITLVIGWLVFSGLGLELWYRTVNKKPEWYDLCLALLLGPFGFLIAFIRWVARGLPIKKP